ncbi:hypothetical protein BJY52DRAFT_524185 [Lactarius psammicola]|nr:hypothetical protein BJY52DRAFT_524185 [Lactarius psammicola]
MRSDLRKWVSLPTLPSITVLLAVPTMIALQPASLKGVRWVDGRKTVLCSGSPRKFGGNSNLLYVGSTRQWFPREIHVVDSSTTIEDGIRTRVAGSTLMAYLCFAFQLRHKTGYPHMLSSLLTQPCDNSTRSSSSLGHSLKATEIKQCSHVCLLYPRK